MRIFIIRFLIYKWISYKSFWIKLISIYYNLIKYIHFLLWYGLVFVLLSFIYTYKYSATSIGEKASNPFKRLIQFPPFYPLLSFTNTLTLLYTHTHIPTHFTISCANFVVIEMNKIWKKIKTLKLKMDCVKFVNHGQY